jgi:predicted  nucleic acid-binding Zn-ribbon protein
MQYTELRILNKARTKCLDCGGKTFAYASYEIGPDKNGDYYLSPDILCDNCGEELE